MSEPSPTLDALQRWMQAVIVHPRGAAAGLESQDARRHLDVPAADLEQVIARSQRQASIERLAIYSHAYFARLLECLRATFPTLAHALGDEAFDELAIAYLHAHPSQSYTLDELGARFASFLDETRPVGAAGARSAAESEVGWPDLLVDLAQFDWAIARVFDGPGTEGEPPSDLGDELRRVAAEDWPQLRFVMAPSLRLLAFRFPVSAYFSARRAGEQPPLPQPSATFLALVRRNYIVERHELTRAEYELLSALAAGQSLLSAIEDAAAYVEPDDDASGVLQSCFQRWAAAGFFQSLKNCKSLETV